MNKRLVKISIVFTIVLVLIDGCKLESDYSRTYKNAISNLHQYFPDSLLLHFPEDTYNEFRLISVFPERCPIYNRCGVIIHLKNDESHVTNLYKTYGLDDSLKIRFWDECNLVVNKFDSIDDCRLYLDFISKCKKPTIPIPNLDKILNNSKTLVKPGPIKLSEFDIFILDGSPGYYLKEEYLSKGHCMPNEWENGFSQGLAINKQNNEVIYWLEIW